MSAVVLVVLLAALAAALYADQPVARHTHRAVAARRIRVQLGSNR